MDGANMGVALESEPEETFVSWTRRVIWQYKKVIREMTNVILNILGGFAYWRAAVVKDDR